MDCFEIILPFPPSVNSLFGGGSKQKRFPSRKYKEWLKSCPDLEPFGIEYCSLVYSFYFPDNRERDTQNYVKAVTDYLVNSGVIQNDSWKHIAHEIIIPMRVDKKNPRVEITIKRAVPRDTPL